MKGQPEMNTTDSAREYRIANFDRFQPQYAAQGFCAQRSPEDRMCTKPAGHNDPLHPGHHAEDRPGSVVEEWAASEVVAATKLQCVKCGKQPHEIPEYKYAAKQEKLTPEQYVREEKGTLNVKTGFFACTECYIAMGQPTGGPRGRWRAGDPVKFLSTPSTEISRLAAPLL